MPTSALQDVYPKGQGAKCPHTYTPIQSPGSKNSLKDKKVFIWRLHIFIVGGSVYLSSQSKSNRKLKRWIEIKREIDSWNAVFHHHNSISFYVYFTGSKVRHENVLDTNVFKSGFDFPITVLGHVLYCLLGGKKKLNWFQNAFRMSFNLSNPKELTTTSVFKFLHDFFLEKYLEELPEMFKVFFWTEKWSKFNF